MLIPEDQALCMLFCKEYNAENVMQLRGVLQSMHEIIICYLDDPTEPVLVPALKHYANPLRYKSSDTTIKVFLDEMFWDSDPLSAPYSQRTMTYADIMDILLSYTNKFSKKNTAAFSKWCNSHDINFQDAVHTGRL